MTHYEDAHELTSPVAAQLLGTQSGKVIGKANSKAYSQRGLEAYPELHFRPEEQRGALLHKSKGETHSRVHGIVGDWEGVTSCGELQC
jgi:hypothetical protein